MFLSISFRYVSRYQSLVCSFTMPPRRWSIRDIKLEEVNRRDENTQLLQQVEVLMQQTAALILQHQAPAIHR